MTVTARVPDTEQYRDFSEQVKQIARDEFNYTYDEEPVNPFVAAFHEAVLLYAIVSDFRSLSAMQSSAPLNSALNETLFSCHPQALNETLAAGGSVSNGTAITSRMWGRTFAGESAFVVIERRVALSLNGISMRDAEDVPCCPLNKNTHSTGRD